MEESKAAFIFNSDESGFSSDPSRLRGIGEKGKPLCRISGGSGRESTSVLLCLSANSSFLPPLIVFKGETGVQARWTENCYPGTQYATSTNGWTEEPQFDNWFKDVYAKRKKFKRT
ncbi:DDE superfamily endonuclease [Popillia japonica]|uniref:DDE superfamily endonuclease n=1 Tax=Popillia japonica TaxID=7064 RepID=A0AAW1HWR1_POPJA